MLAAITLLLVYQLIGEAIAFVFKLPVPGPVIGMLLLFLTLIFKGGMPGAFGGTLRETANSLLSHLSLLFVPAGVGVMVHFGRISDEWLPILAALVGSTVLTIAATALTMRWLMSRGRVTKTRSGQAR
jgi:holin-like protein